MMLKRLPIIFKFLFFLLISISISRAEILKPSSGIKPVEVVRIQLTGLQQNDLEFKDSGIAPTWTFAHPNNKKVTGPLDNFKTMIKVFLGVICAIVLFVTLETIKYNKNRKDATKD